MRNFRATDWKKFKERLVTTLADGPVLAIIETPESFRMALDNINTAIKSTIEAEVPINKPIPHTKCWWNHDLTVARNKKYKLANLAHK